MKRFALAAIVASLAAFAVFLCTKQARAFERQNHFGLGPSVAILKIDDKSTADVGAGGGIQYAYGVTDQFNFMVEGSYEVVALNQKLDFPSSPHTRPSTITTVGAGVGYVLDILRYVPYFGVLGTGYAMQGGTIENTRWLGGIAIAAGLDYQLDRNWAVGFAFRQHMMLTDMSTYPSYSEGFLRAEYIWGW